MRKNSNQRSLFILFSVSSFIIISTYIISLIARGYRFSIKDGLILNPTGMISATSRPKGASVYVDEKLITATDDTINLPPGVYSLKINKDGFLPWQKKITIKPETVYQADIQLFSAVPDLKPLTLTGAINPASNIENTKIVYAVASASASKDNGLYLIESNGLPVSLIRGVSRQISSNTATIDWSKYSFTFSPNSREVLATNLDKKINYLINLDAPVDPTKLIDKTDDLPSINQNWQLQTTALLSVKIDRIPKEIQPLISTSSAKNIQFSSDENKILYLAQTDGSINKNIVTPPPAQSTQNQSRSIKEGNYYVYDIKDDTNFLLGDINTLSNPSWIPNSNNIIYVHGQNLNVTDYDGTNQQTLFSSNFDPNCVYPWVDGSKIVILTSAYPTAQENLYTISIK